MNKQLIEALELALAHIGWCWDMLEDHTRLRREGSADIHERLLAALEVARHELETR